MVSREKASWIETATASNAAAAASRAAPQGGIRHYVTSVSGSLSESANDAELTLLSGDVIVGRWRVFDGFALVFPSPIEMTPGLAVTLSLGAGGVGIDGSVNLTGYTL